MRPPRTFSSAVAASVGVCIAVALVWSASSNPPVNVCGPGGGSGTTPFGSAFALGVPKEAAVGPNHWYNASVLSAQPNLELGNLEMQIQTQGGSGVPPGPLWNLTVVNMGGTPVGAYVLAGAGAGSWSWGQHQALLNNLVLDLLANPQNLSGYAWVVYLVGSDVNGCSVSGSITVGIP